MCLSIQGDLNACWALPDAVYCAAASPQRLRRASIVKNRNTFLIRRNPKEPMILKLYGFGFMVPAAERFVMEGQQSAPRQ
jgi:hypothetical protein